MKKLMTMLAAVGMAFGLFADGHIIQTSFEGAAEFDANGKLITTSTAWTCLDEGATLQQTAYGTETPYNYKAGDVTMDRLFTDDNENYLAVKTTFGKPLVHANAETSAESQSVYLDQLVKFTAFEEKPTTVYEDAKLLIYARDMSEAEGSEKAAATNLFVRAYQWAGDEHALIDYNLGAIDDLDAWHRVTVKAIKAFNNNLGFVVYVDGKARVGDVAGYTGSAVAGLATAAKALNTARKIFPAAADGYELSAVGFDGQGWIDDVTVTTADIGTWAEDKNIIIAWQAGVSALTYQVNDETAVQLTGLTTAGTETLPYIADMTLKLTPTFATNVGFKDILVGNGAEVGDSASYTKSDATYTVTGLQENKFYTIMTKDTTPRMVVLDADGHETSKTYPTFEEAFADSTLATGTLKLKMDVEVDKKSDGSTAGTIGSGKDITIDLAGKTITGIANFAEGGYIFNVLGGKLTVKDSSGDNSGKIVIGKDANYGGVISVGSLDDQNIGMLNISGGTFAGAIVVDQGQEGPEGWPAAEAEISDGKFLVKVDDAVLPRGKKWVAPVDPETYWTIGAADYATLTITKTGATATVKVGEEEITAASATVYEGDVITVTDAAAEPDYEEPTVTIKGAKQTSYTVVAGDIGNTIAVVVTAEPAEYTITFDTDGGKELDWVTFTVKDLPVSLSTHTTTKDGYTFNEWTDDDGNTYAQDGQITVTGDVNLTADWEAKNYGITYVVVDVDGKPVEEADYELDEETFPDTYTIEDDDIVFDSSKVTIINTEKYEAVESISPEKIESGSTEVKTVTITLTLASVEPDRPSDVEGGSPEQKAAYDQWAKDNEITGTAANNAVAFALGVTKKDIGEGTIEQAIEKKLDAAVALTADEVAALTTGETPAAFTLDGYPNAQFQFVETKDIQSAAGKFFRLTAVFLPENND